MRNRLIAVVSVIALVLVAFLAGRHYWGMIAGEDNTGAAIGGPFTLVDTRGQTVTDADFRGQFMLVYFGYTYCPDVCPTSLSTIAAAFDILGDKAEAIKPIFITVDPERDTREAMTDYVAAFHPRLVGLTGTAEQVAAAARAYRVFFSKVQEEGNDPDDYLMDHSAYVYLMDRDGKYLTHFPHGIAPEEMARQLAEFL